MTQTAHAGYLLLGNATLDEEDAVLVALGLHRGAHHAEDGPEGSFAGSEAGNEGVHRTLTWSDGVRVARFQAERVAAVVETNAGSFGDYTAAETSVEAVYERTAVALRVDGAEIGSIAPRVGRRDHHCGVAGDRPAKPRSVVFGEQLLGRYDGMCRISYLIVQVLEG